MAKLPFHRLRLVGGDAGRTCPRGPWARVCGSLTEHTPVLQKALEISLSACPPSWELSLPRFLRRLLGQSSWD